MSAVLFAGRPGHSSQLGSHLLGGTLIAGALGLLGYLLIERGMSVHDNAQSAGYVGVAVLAAVGLVFILRAVTRVMSMRYRIDDLRVEVEHGLVMKKIDNLELWRVKDIRFRQGLLQRMLSTGVIEIDSTDVSDRVLIISGLRDARGIYDKLRDAIDGARRARGVVAVDADTLLSR